MAALYHAPQISEVHAKEILNGARYQHGAETQRRYIDEVIKTIIHVYRWGGEGMFVV